MCARPLQAFAGFEAGTEAAVHSMKHILGDKDNEGVILVDVTSAFNCMNRKVALYNIQVTCPILAKYIINSYRAASRLFITGKYEITSEEGTTQGGPLAMPWFSLNTVAIIDGLQNIEPKVK